LGAAKVVPWLKSRDSQLIARQALHDSVIRGHTNLMGNRVTQRPLPGAIVRWLAAGLLGACAAPGWGLVPSTPLANYGRQSWVMENGLPQNTVQALLQTKGGFVWLGTEVGLIRFDGNSFETFDKSSRPALPGNDVRCLMETKAGTLWIGTSEGLARWQDGKVVSFTTANGLPANGIRGLVEDNNEEIWVWTDGGLSVLAGDRFLGVPEGEGQPRGAVTSLTGSGGGVWVGTTTGVYYRWKGSWNGPMLAAAFPNEGVEQLAVRPGGALAVASKNAVVFERGNGVIERLTAGKELPGSKVQVIYGDKGGSVWIGTNSGLVRWADGTVQRFPVNDSLATESILGVMEDAEGNLWVGTETGGLHILRDQRFRLVGARDGLSSDETTTVVEDESRTLWVGTEANGLNAVKQDGGVKTYTVKDGLVSDVILSLAAGQHGEIWVGTPDGLNRIEGGKVEAFTSADGLPDDFIRSLLVDEDGSLWVGTRRGLAHWSGKAGAPMTTFTTANGLGSDLVGAIARDKRGNLWVATLGGLARLHGATMLNYTTKDGLSSNVVTALMPRGNGTMVIGTQDHGWNLWDGLNQISAVKYVGLERANIHAILDDGADHLWFATSNGIGRCDIDLAGGCYHWIGFGTADGLRSQETAINSHPSAWRGRDGRLWFATPKGLVEVVDPGKFPVNKVPPPVAVERFVVDDVAMNLADSPVKVAAGGGHFEFDYAGMSYTAPLKVRYRYMLEGFDKDWTEAGTRRVAYYTAIPPGHYTFRVQAANNDGVWNEAGAGLPFDLKPRFYQSLWFYALMTLLAAGLVVAATMLVQRRRMLRTEREFNAVLGERNRIAREIHDTLAQGYVGVSVQLEVLAELLRKNRMEAAVKQLDKTRTQVREGLAEARQSIWALRSQDSGEKTLPVRLRRMAENAGLGGLETQFLVFGAYRPLSQDTEQELLRIAQEAIQNVQRHSGAKCLTAQIEYLPGAVALEIRDDGRGFDMTEAAEREGHYGLTGMRERAATLGGTLEITSGPGRGTTVRVRATVAREAREQEEQIGVED
jgi:signal transduction histidine kinase/ligand-binding sensor domain-containing protein